MTTKQNELLWEERDSINRSNDLADIIIGQAIEDNENIEQQNKTMKTVNERNSILTALFNDSSRISRGISWHQNKNTIILSFVCACCIFFILWYSFL